MRIGWMIAIKAKIPMRTSPNIPILFSRNSAQLRANDRRKRRSRTRHIGVLTSSAAAAESEGSIPTGCGSSCCCTWVGSPRVICCASRYPDPGVEHGVEHVGDQVADERQHAGDGEDA